VRYCLPKLVIPAWSLPETLIAANAKLVSAQSRIQLARAWGGGEVASADGMRFVVPMRSIHSGPNPKYFGHGRGVTWYNLISDQFSGLNAITVPESLRDSMALLAVVLEQQTELQPTQIMTDTAAPTAMSSSVCSGSWVIALVLSLPTSAARARGGSTRMQTTGTQRYVSACLGREST
jgi:TnpA family transposase